MAVGVAGGSGGILVRRWTHAKLTLQEYDKRCLGELHVQV